MTESLINQALVTCFEKAGITKHYRSKSQIYLQGDYSNDFYFLKEGRVRAYMIAQDGHEVTLEILEKGRIFGEASFFSQSQRLTCIEAVCDVEIIACQYEAFVPFLEKNPELLASMFQLLAKTTKNLSQQVSRLCFLDAKQKIADFLLCMTDHPAPEIRASNDCLFYTHQEISECVNLQRVTVTRLLNELQEAGWISLKYRQVKILDRKALQEYVRHQL